MYHPEKAVSTDTGFLARFFSEPKAGWEKLAARALSVIDHQNELRKTRGLRLWKRQVISDDSIRWRDDPKIVNLMLSDINHSLFVQAIGSLMIAGGWGDAKDLNHAYVFSADETMTAIPLGFFLLNTLPGDTIHLNRALSYNEALLWKNRDIETLKKNKRHWGYKQGVIHLYLNVHGDFYNDSEAGAEFIVKKETLKKWLQVTSVPMGAVEYSYKVPERYVFEVVINESLWNEFAPCLNSFRRLSTSAE